MAMSVAIDTSFLALDFIPEMQRELDLVEGDGRRFQIHRVSVYATILPHDSEIEQLLNSPFSYTGALGGPLLKAVLAKREALEWQTDPDDDLGDAAVLQHLHQQAATVPLLSSVFSQSDRGYAATTLTGSALSASIHARTKGRLLSSFHRHSFRGSNLVGWVPRYFNGGFCPVPLRPPSIPIYAQDRTIGLGRRNSLPALFAIGAQDRTILDFCLTMCTDPSQLIVWAGPQPNHHLVFSQVQVDVVDLFSTRLPTSRARKRRRTAFNQFLQVSHSPVIEDTSKGNPLTHAKRFNGVRYRPDREIYVAEMKPTKHKTKQDFGNFKSEAEAAHAVDAAFHHYGRPDLLNFPHTSLQFLFTRPPAPAGLDEKAKVKFVKEEAKLLLAATAASSPLHSTHTNSLQSLELSASPRRCPSGPFRSLSEISSPFRYSGPDEVDAVVSQPQSWMLPDSICDIFTAGVLTNLETQNFVQSAEQGWDWPNESCALEAPPNVVNPVAYESQSMWPDSIIRSSPAPTCPRSPSPSHSQEDVVYALLAHQSI